MSYHFRWYSFVWLSLYAVFYLGRMYERLYVCQSFASRVQQSNRADSIQIFHRNHWQSLNSDVHSPLVRNRSNQNPQVLHNPFSNGSQTEKMLLNQKDTKESQKPVGTVDVAFGMAQGVHELNLAVFVKSLREFSNCMIVLFMYINMTSKARLLCEKFNVTVVEYDVEKIMPTFIRKFHPSTYRWFLMHQFLNQSIVPFKRILLADVRDTAFQSDPFSIGKDLGLHVFEEGKRFREDGHTRSWVSDCFGSAIADQFAERWIVCSGISIGTADDVRLYLNQMSAAMSTPSFVACERNGVDQGVHNVLVYNNPIPGLRRLSEKDGYVAHMQNTLMHVHRHVTHESPGFRLTVAQAWDKSPVRIVHQYDRDIHLQAWLFGRYMEWAEVESAPGVGACAGYSLFEDVDLLFAIGDLTDGHTNSTGLQGCCQDCSERPGCNGFLHKPGKGCWLKNADTPRPLQQAVPIRGSTTGWRKRLWRR